MYAPRIIELSNVLTCMHILNMGFRLKISKIMANFLKSCDKYDNEFA